MTLKLPVISAVIITLNLKMTSAQITEKPVINNSPYQFHLPKDQIPNDKNKVSPLLYSCDVSMNVPLDTCIFLVYLI